MRTGPKKPGHPLSLRARALQALALREHSRTELRAKLLRKCPDGTDEPAEVDTLLDELQAHGLLSESRFIESRIHVRAPRFGNHRIQQELQRHGVALDPATAAELRHTELQRAQAVWARRFGQVAITPQERARQMRFLAGRGFSADVIRRAVQGSDDEGGNPGHAEDPGEHS